MINPFLKSPNHTTLLTKMSLGMYLGLFVLIVGVIVAGYRLREE